MLERLTWSPVANEVRTAIEGETDERRATLGQGIVDRLSTFGPFYDELFNQRELDERIIESARRNPTPGVPAVQATLTIGGLTLVAMPIGDAGNTITAEVLPGVASNYAIPPVDKAISSVQLDAAKSMLHGGTPPLSTDPQIAALQLEAVAFLAGISAKDRENAELKLADDWPRYREGRDSLDYPPDVDKINQQIAEFYDDLDDLVKNNIDSFKENVAEQKASSIASIFTLKVRKDDLVETFPELVPGYPLNLGDSVLVGSAAWGFADRPVDGEYAFSGGINAVSSTTGRMSSKSVGSYVFHLDARRSFTLLELEDVVEVTIAAARSFLNV